MSTLIYLFLSTFSLYIQGKFTFATKLLQISGDDSVSFGLTNEGLVESISDVVGTVTGDFTRSVSINGTEIHIAGDSAVSVTSSLISGISSGASVSVSNMIVTTDNNGNFKVGNEIYTLEDVNRSVTFLTAGNGAVLEVTECEGTLKTSANSVKVNYTTFTTSNTDASIISASVGISRVTGLVSGDSVSGALETTTVIISSDGTLTINEHDYILSGDTSGVEITDNRTDGLDNNASLRVGVAGNYASIIQT